LDGTRSKIHAGDLPTSFRKGNHICTCTTADINGAAGLISFNEFYEFGWTDARVPGRLAKVQVIKGEAAKQVLHFLFRIRPQYNFENVRVLTLTIQLSSFTITRLGYLSTAFVHKFYSLIIYETSSKTSITMIGRADS
jgi:hypothetical protein